MVEPAEHAEAVVDGDDDDVAFGREARPVVDARIADRVAAAVDPHHHRQARVALRHRVAGELRRVDVEVEAVFVADDLGRVGHVELHALLAGLARLAHAIPGFGRLGCAPAQLAGRRLSERDALPDVRGVVFVREADDAALGERALGSRVGFGRGTAAAAERERRSSDRHGVCASARRNGAGVRTGRRHGELLGAGRQPAGGAGALGRTGGAGGRSPAVERGADDAASRGAAHAWRRMPCVTRRWGRTNRAGGGLRAQPSSSSNWRAAFSTASRTRSSWPCPAPSKRTAMPVGRFVFWRLPGTLV